MARKKTDTTTKRDNLLFVDLGEEVIKDLGKETPLMQQYNQTKAKYPDALLLFRVGDFYETFGEDAIKTANTLGIILTSRNNGGNDVELAGFPYHSLDMYLPRLVRAGFRVAICEQLEKPSKEKKIVRRGVTEIVTPGVAISDNLLHHQQNNFLATLHASGKGSFGAAFLDLSTGEFLVTEGDRAYIDKMFQSLQPSEIVFSKRIQKDFALDFGDKWYTYSLEDWVFTPDFTQEKLQAHFQVQNLKGFGVDDLELAKIAAGAALHYVATTENKNLQHISSLSRILPDRYVWLDRFTIRSLELLQSQHETGVPLIQVLDKTVTSMGSRLLKKWVALPLKHIPEIESRLDIVDYFLQNTDLATHIDTQLRLIGDLERLISKVPMGKTSPREIVQLKKTLFALEPIKHRLLVSDNIYLKQLGDKIQLCTLIRDRIARELVDDAPVAIAKGGAIADGVSDELDELRGIIANSKDLLLKIQQSEAIKSGIQGLKIGYNNVFGYYLEVTNKYKEVKIPDDWVRKQTLSTGERYITDDLKKLETKILTAEETILGLEEKLFQELTFALTEYITPIQHNAQLLARLDCLLSFTKVAQKNNYTRPVVTESFTLDIKQGRHPVIEQQLPPDAPYIPNDIYMNNEDQQIFVITGPNMAGKSALLRQTALIALMAQMGSFVPADSAEIGLLDKVFTRVGASDNIAAGESTFMVEMNETASILNNVSPRSLILLDEIGRGTSTYDGISIAWSIAEYLHNNGFAQPKTLFATHYHELNELADRNERVHNYHIATKEIGQKVIFLRKLVAGGTSSSFGIHVAKIAGMPRSIIDRANEILVQLEQKHIETQPENGKLAISAPSPKVQYTDEKAMELKDELAKIDINTLTPMDCMLKLAALKRLMD